MTAVQPPDSRPRVRAASRFLGRDAWLKPGQAARHSGLSVASIRHYMRIGLLPSTRIADGPRRVRRSDLDRFLAVNNEVDRVITATADGRVAQLTIAERFIRTHGLWAEYQAQSRGCDVDSICGAAGIPDESLRERAGQ